MLNFRFFRDLDLGLWEVRVSGGGKNGVVALGCCFEGVVFLEGFILIFIYFFFLEYLVEGSRVCFFLLYYCEIWDVFIFFEFSVFFIKLVS